MSADPKSLATLALTHSKSKQKIQKSASNEGLQESNEELNGRTIARSPSENDETNGARDNELVNITHKFNSRNEFMAGCTAALVNTTLLFPINKLIFRQMAGGHGASEAADQMKEEGLRYLYRGILPPLIQKMASVSIMFGSFGQYKKWADHRFASWPPVANLALAACLTGATEAILTPLERVQMLLQHHKYHKDYKNTLDALIQLRRYGFTEYYRGLTCVLLRNGPSNILFFGLRDEIKKLMPKFNRVNFGDFSTSFATTTSSAFVPSHMKSEEEQQQLIIHKLLSSQSNSTTTTPQAQLYPLQELSPAAAAATAKQDNMLYDFFSGAILGMFISTLFYPLSVVRTRMQTRAPGTEFLSIKKAFDAVYNERGRKFSRLFHGCLINVMRQFVSWGIINCSYEVVLEWLHKIDD